jgi:YidC/Oxa1 family membrane protein insertase
VEKRLLIFLPIALALLYGSMWLEQARRQANAPPNNVAQNNPAQNNNNPAPNAGQNGAGKAGGDNKAPAEKPPPAIVAAGNNGAVPAMEPKDIADQWFTLGSVAPPDAQSPYQMLVTLTNQGAAVQRVELSNPRYRDVEDRSGYLGSLAWTSDKAGCRVHVVGPGTPAAAAGVQPDDVIVELNGHKTTERDFEADTNCDEAAAILHKTEPGQSVEITVQRDGAEKKLTAKLGVRPLSVIRPELNTDAVNELIPGKHDPLSFLFTLAKVDEDGIAADADKVNGEIKDLALRNGKWEGRRIDADTVEFSRVLPRWGLTVVKRYQLAKITDAPTVDPGYSLTLHVEVRNTSKETHSVAYQLDGPTGLPTEGWWYASRIGPSALRDVAIKFQGNPVTLTDVLPLANQKLAEEEAKAAGNPPPKKDETPAQRDTEEAPLIFGGVDAQYFASTLIPLRADGPKGPWLAETRPIIVGAVPKENPLRKKVDASCRFTSITKKLEPDAKLIHDYQIFTGPKQPALLEQYGAGGGENLGGLVYYGWFGWVSKPLVAVLSLFYMIVGNYGIAIIMLTVVVRLCMFPLSRKQAMSAKKMQELQPEMKKINEKFKGKPEERTRATQELWRKHNYNPMGGCLLVFIQLPIFMGLYRSLMVNVELRGSSLLGSAVRWCSNLAAPDMFWRWDHVVPAFFSSETTGWLGPFLNILPLITVSLFIWQQMLFMPPATDDNTKLQQKMMKYMTLFMGVMFFKVAAGLCLYFISSSLWGIAERKLLPKTLGTDPNKSDAALATSRSNSAGSNGSSAAQRRKQRGRK